MRNWSKYILPSTAFLFFGSIFVLSFILRADILAPIFPEAIGQSTEQSNHDVTSTWLEENNEAKINDVSSTRPKIICYLTIPSELNSTDYLDPSKVDPHLCTHILVGFASVVNCTIHLGDNTQVYTDASNLKKKNPELKVMISVGGINEVYSGFPEMTRNHANRKKFIKSVLEITKTLHIDGLDIDWEFPAWLDLDGRQKIHFIQLLYELKKAFNKSNRKLVLSAAVAAKEAIIDQCYNVPEIAEHVDFVNLMGYDYHFYSRLLPVTGFNAPLFPSALDTGLWSSMNLNYSANYWVDKGMPREKIIVGISTYGHSFTLYNPQNHGLYAPCKGFGAMGEAGFISYPMACSFLENGAIQVFQNDSKVPYAFRDTEWISYDDVNSVTEKAKWLRSAGFGGAMIFSLNTDDWNATCDGTSSFPLVRAITKIVGYTNEAT